MAKIVPNDKGFKVIQMSYAEISRLTGNVLPICDSCAKPDVSMGYYIAVLNQWFCKRCYNNWYKDAKFYPEDTLIENRNYEYYKNLCEKAGMLQNADKIWC